MNRPHAVGMVIVSMCQSMRLCALVMMGTQILAAPQISTSAHHSHAITEGPVLTISMPSFVHVHLPGLGILVA